MIRNAICRMLAWCFRPSQEQLQEAIRAFVHNEIAPHIVAIQRDHDMLAKAICELEILAYEIGDRAPPDASPLFKSRYILRH
jgi:hypothetical protein